MNFLLETGDPTIYVLLAIGAALAIIFFIRSKITSKKNTNDEIADNSSVVTTETVDNNADEEIIAVIAAAIAMAESESNGLKFKVVSFRRI
jgi:Na+-transporting methylmalonyl-CoA/oxaloacetate decarboxylase gamma subunit